MRTRPIKMSDPLGTLPRAVLTLGGSHMKKEEEGFVSAAEIPSQGPGLQFDAEGDVPEALIQSLLDEAHNLAREEPSLVFVREGRLPCTLVFTEPAPVPLVRAMIKLLGSGMLTPVRLEALKLRPLLRINAEGFSLFLHPVLPGEVAA